jgi:SAM-dependent methyltransferase
MAGIKTLKRPIRIEEEDGPPRFIVKDALARVRRLFFRGDAIECSCCGLEFGQYLYSPYMATLCPNCLSIERYRLLCRYLEHETEFAESPMRVLDIAPMWYFQEFCRRHDNIDYLSIDIASPLAMRHMDIRALDLPDDSFDCIICYHVLEHIDEEAQAVSELYRVLKPGGWGVIQVPIHVPKTIERDELTEAQATRIMKFPDHLRAYGPDYPEVLEAGGFTVEVVPFAKSFTEEELARYGLDVSEDLYVSYKP